MGIGTAAFRWRGPTRRVLSGFGACFVLVVAPSPSRAAFADAGSIRGSVSATAADSTARPSPISGASLTLVNRSRPAQFVTTSTDYAGNFAFVGLPAATYVLKVGADGLASVSREVVVASTALVIDIVLAATVTESITVRDDEGLLSTAQTTTTNTIRGATLSNVPLRAENYQSALLLTPGVVRSTDGLDHVKGAGAGQSAYSVNGTDVTDPATGKLAFNIPLEAAANVQIEENPYSAGFGSLTGGATNLETKGGADDLAFTAARFFPTFHDVVGGELDSFRPRVTLSGPILRDRIFFLQSVEYRFSRTHVPGLASPGDSSTVVGFNSFSQIDISLNETNHLKVIASVFPQTEHFVGLSTFNPRETTPDLEERGYLVSVAEQAIFPNGSFLDSTLSYKPFDVDVRPQGPEPLTLLPDGNTGNFFAGAQRRTSRVQWRETYHARPFSYHGQHTLVAGAELDHTNASVRPAYSSILIRRADGTLDQRIDFAGMGTAAQSASGVGIFVQDRWIVGPQLTIGTGVRVDRNGLSQGNDVSPRLSLMWLPRKNDRTIVRGGIGLFYGRIPLSAGYFDQMPERIVTTLTPDGLSVLDGPRRFTNTLAGPLRSPRSVRWSLQFDRGITRNLLVRVGYLDRSTSRDLVVDPIAMGIGAGALVVGASGRSRYRELQFLTVYNSPRLGDWTASYVRSSAHGDLNTADGFLGDRPGFVVRPDENGPLPFDSPHRFLAFGIWRTRGDIVVSPSLEVRSGFPYSFVDERLDFVGPRNRAGRFPMFLTLDVQVTKGFAIPLFESHRARVGLAVLNVTNHFNPGDVQNNLGSSQAGQFFSSLGTSIRGKFEIDF